MSPPPGPTEAAELSQDESKAAAYYALVQEEAPRVAAARNGDGAALNWLAEVTLPSRRKIAIYFLGPRNLYLEDGIQHGWYGVLRALPKYDPSRQVRFSDYCVPQIYNKIGKFRFDVPQTIRIPVWAQEAKRKARKTSLTQAETVEQLIEMGMTRHVAVVVSSMNFATLQEEYAEEENDPRANAAIVPDPARDAAETISNEEERHWMRYAVQKLTKSQQAVLKSEFGFTASEEDGGSGEIRERRQMGTRRRKTYLAALNALRLHAEEADIHVDRKGPLPTDEDLGGPPAPSEPK